MDSKAEAIRYAEKLGVKTEGRDFLSVLTETLDLVEDLYEEMKNQSPTIFENWQVKNSELIRWHNRGRSLEQQMLDKKGCK